MSPSDRPIYTQASYVTRELFQSVGITVNFQQMDWGSLVTRRTNRNPTDKGGWSAYNTALDGVTSANPGGNQSAGLPAISGRATHILASA